jgi:hypothetical protein
MRRWLGEAMSAARLVSEWPELWLPGALAWVSSIGWIPLVVAVVRIPSAGELPYIGAGFASSGAWPWNAAAFGAAVVAIVLVAFGLVTVADATLLAMLERRRPSRSDAARLLGIGLAAAIPAMLIMVVLLVALAFVAPSELNAPGADDPRLRTVLRVAPLLVALAIAIVAGITFAAVAERAGGIGSGTRRLPFIGPAGLAQVVIGTVVDLALLALTALLLGVLWAPIGDQLERGEIDVAAGLLLVGFVAIWLCLVLAGGALHAWSATTWSRLLAAGPRPT